MQSKPQKAPAIPSWVTAMVTNARCRANERGIPFDLVPQDVLELWELQCGNCYWFNIPMQWRDGEGPRNPLIPTLDRADNSRGYVRSNVVLACWGANAAKGSSGLDQWEEFLGFVQHGLATKGKIG